MKKIELNTCLVIILGAITLLELVSLTGLISSPHGQLYRTLFSERNIYYYLSNTLSINEATWFQVSSLQVQQAFVLRANHTVRFKT